MQNHSFSQKQQKNLQQTQKTQKTKISSKSYPTSISKFTVKFLFLGFVLLFLCFLLFLTKKLWFYIGSLMFLPKTIVLYMFFMFSVKTNDFLYIFLCIQLKTMVLLLSSYVWHKLYLDVCQFFKENKTLLMVFSSFYTNLYIAIKI